MHKNSSIHVFIVLILVICMLAITPASYAQKSTDYEARRVRAFELYNDNKLTDAKTIFEKLAVENPQDREVQMMLGVLIVAHAANIQDAELRRKERVRGRQYLVRAKELGAESTLMTTLLESVPPDGTVVDVRTSKNEKAEQYMQEAETAFASGDFDKALEAYQRALIADPKLYLAALFTGDVYRKTDRREKAAEWFARSISIDPNIETAHRYWGEMLMLNGELDAARDKLIEAYVLSPYYRLTAASLAGWGDRKQLVLRHPKIDIPSNVTKSPDESKTTINIDTSMLNGKDDGKSAWMGYGIVRATWMNEKFLKTYPNETVYRHSLAEEAAALRSVLALLSDQIKSGKVKTLDPSLAKLKTLSDAGLLEAYILLARADEGISKDYEAYLNSNRGNLRRYVVEIILTGGGK